MFLKLFTAFTIILISRSLTTNVDISLENNKEFNVIVEGTLSWNDQNVKNVKGELQKNDKTVTSAKYEQNPSTIYLTAYKYTTDSLDAFSVKFGYDVADSGLQGELVKKIPENCINVNSDVNDETLNLKDGDFTCNLGYVYIAKN
uniref:CBM49 domain-containing protein n=1 Tax=Strongyloides papillosus TaxID=174720 RepID=A0A0N5BF02_STREA